MTPPLAFETIDQHVFRSTRERLKRLLGCSAAVLQHEHYHRLATGHPTWQADGVALLCLGGLSRWYYHPKRPRFPWEEPTRALPHPDLPEPVSAELDLALPERLPRARTTQALPAPAHFHPHANASQNAGPSSSAPVPAGRATESAQAQVPERKDAHLRLEPSQGPQP